MNSSCLEHLATNDSKFLSFWDFSQLGIRHNKDFFPPNKLKIHFQAQNTILDIHFILWFECIVSRKYNIHTNMHHIYTNMYHIFYLFPQNCICIWKKICSPPHLLNIWLDVHSFTPAPYTVYTLWFLFSFWVENAFTQRDK